MMDLEDWLVEFGPCDIDPGKINPAVEIEISGRPNMARIVDSFAHRSIERTTIWV